MLASLKYLLQLSDQKISAIPSRVASSCSFRIVVSLEDSARLEQNLNIIKQDFPVHYSIFPILKNGEEQFSFIVEVPDKRALEQYVQTRMTLDKIRLRWLCNVKSAITEYTYLNARTEKLGLELMVDSQKLGYLVGKKIIKQYDVLNSTKTFATHIDSKLLQQEFNLFWEGMVDFFQINLGEKLDYERFLLGSYDLLFKIVCDDELIIFNKIKQLNQVYDLGLSIKGEKSNFSLIIPAECAGKIQILIGHTMHQSFSQSTTGICAQLGTAPGANISDNNNFDSESGNAGVPPLYVNHVQPDVEPENEAIQGNVGFVPSTTTSFSSNM